MTTWRDTSPLAGVCFAGRGARLPEDHRRAWLEQVHGAESRTARAGWCGRGDALVSRRPDLALLVVTADCVPVLLAGPESIAAVHAGWRGIARRVVESAVARMGAAPPSTAWIGPAIGACCYEVGEGVAREVAKASSENVVDRSRGPRPHLDLHAAVAHQLEELGVGDVRRTAVCTQCHPERLWSYRREGAGAGRNVAMIWPAGA